MRLEARSQINNAIRAGRVSRGTCVLLGPECEGMIEAHHDDYSQPLRVFWLCHRHHRKVETGNAVIPADAKPVEVGPKVDGRKKNHPPTRMRPQGVEP
jgi:hypothetical protein